MAIPNTGGTNGKVVTAYRQDALRDLQLALSGERGADERRSTVARSHGRKDRDADDGDQSLWLVRAGVERGVYGLTPELGLRRL